MHSSEGMKIPTLDKKKCLEKAFYSTPKARRFCIGIGVYHFVFTAASSYWNVLFAWSFSTDDQLEDPTSRILVKNDQ